MRNYLLAGFLLFFSLSLVSKETSNKIIKKLNYTQPFTVSKPIMLDSTDTGNQTYSTKSLLETNYNIPNLSDFYDIQETFDGVFELSPISAENGIQYFGFNIWSTQFDKVELIIKSPNMFEVYADGKKIANKDKEEKDKKLTETKSKFDLLPYEQKNIVIKVLRSKELADNENLSISVQCDEPTNIQTSNNNKRRTKIEDNLVGNRATSASLSPNGDFLLSNFASVNDEGTRTESSLLYNLKEKNPIPTPIPNRYYWMPTSNLLYHTKKINDKFYSVSTRNPLTSEEKIIVSEIPSNASIRFLANEKQLVYQESKNFDKRKGDIKAILSPEDRLNGYLSRNILYLLDIETGVSEQLFFGKNSIYIDDVSKDSKLLLLSSYNETITERPFRTKNSFILNLETKKIDTILVDEPFVGSGSFSPDSKKIVYLGSAEGFDNVGNTLDKDQIPNSYNTLAFIYDIESKSVDPFTKDFNPSIKSVQWVTQNTIYLNTVDEVYENLYAYTLGTKKFQKLDVPGDVITQYDIDNTGSKICYIARSIKSPTEIYVYDTKSRKDQQITSPMQETMNQLTLGEVKDWKYVANDSTVIDGFYHLPPDFDPSKKYPMLVYYYGGTTPTSKTFEHPYSMHYFASLGYIVYTIIPSGSIGYGQEFAARHVNAWGIQTADDIINATKDFVAKHPYVEGDKIGCLGASYGGFMTMYLLTQTDLFKAAIAHAGISALSSYWGEGYWGYSYSSGASANSYPWNNPDLYVKQSPLFNADKVNTPLLLTHGTVDTNVPIGESIQMFTALKILGKPVDFLQVSNENHGISTFQKKIDWSHSMGAWFDRYLKDQPKWWYELYPETKQE